MQLQLKFRDMLPGRLGHVVGEELDQLIASIVAFFSVEHRGDGTHGDVTATSLSVAGDATVTGEVHASAFYGPGIGMDDIPETSIADGALLARLADSETIVGAWAFSTVPSLSTLTGFLKASSGAISADALGWTAVTHAGGNFTSDSGSWTVAVGDQTSFRYWLAGKCMVVEFDLATTTTTGTPGELRITLPASATCNKAAVGSAIGSDNGGSDELLFCECAASATYVKLRRVGASWSTATDTTAVRGTIVLEIQ